MGDPGLTDICKSATDMAAPRQVQRKLGAHLDAKNETEVGIGGTSFLVSVCVCVESLNTRNEGFRTLGGTTG